MADGLSDLEASAQTCQDVLLVLIAKSPLAHNVAIKGGVVMKHLSGDNRRATQDFDFDFIRYSIEDNAIRQFIDALSSVTSNITIAITKDIEELKHQSYSGKRVHIRLTDSAGTGINTKLDIGVHKKAEISQDEYCFTLDKADGSVTLLVNSKEQIVVEKLQSLIKLGPFSTRYKDIYDMYYLLEIEGVDRSRFDALIASEILQDPAYRENTASDIHKRLENTLTNRRFVDAITRSKKNWLDVSYDDLTKSLLEKI